MCKLSYSDIAVASEVTIVWVSSAGFAAVRVVDINQTSQSEQRTTEWMPSHSLLQALDEDKTDQTIEGYPRPLRAILVAQR